MKLLLPLLLLLCLELTLVCIHAEESSSMERNFNVEQISGYWFSIAEASDEREKIEEHGSMRAFVENITVLENSLVFKFHLIVNEECTEMTAIGEQTEKAGIYYMNYDGFNTFSILKTDYDNYIMIHLINKKDGKTFQLMELYGRLPMPRFGVQTHKEESPGKKNKGRFQVQKYAQMLPRGPRARH